MSVSNIDTLSIGTPLESNMTGGSFFYHYRVHNGWVPINYSLKRYHSRLVLYSKLKTVRIYRKLSMDGDNNAIRCQFVGHNYVFNTDCGVKSATTRNLPINIQRHKNISIIITKFSGCRGITPSKSRSLPCLTIPGKVERKEVTVRYINALGFGSPDKSKVPGNRFTNGNSINSGIPVGSAGIS